MNMIGFGNIAFFMLSVLLGLAFRILFVFAVYYNAESRGSDKTSNYVGFSIFFPVITGIVCLFNLKNFKDKAYYWASSVIWDENGKMHDSYDKVIQ